MKDTIGEQVLVGIIKLWCLLLTIFTQKHITYLQMNQKILEAMILDYLPYELLMRLLALVQKKIVLTLKLYAQRKQWDLKRGFRIFKLF